MLHWQRDYRRWLHYQTNVIIMGMSADPRTSRSRRNRFRFGKKWRLNVKTKTMQRLLKIVQNLSSLCNCKHFYRAASACWHVSKGHTFFGADDCITFVIWLLMLADCTRTSKIWTCLKQFLCTPLAIADCPLTKNPHGQPNWQCWFINFLLIYVPLFCNKVAYFWKPSQFS